jgi:hypothetical protein
VAKSVASHHAISAPFAKAIDISGKPLVVQYEVKYQKGGNCGGGYLKLLEDGFQTSGKEFSDNTPWVVMFGPDLTCPGTKVCFLCVTPSAHIAYAVSCIRFISSSVIKARRRAYMKRST